MLLHLQLPLPFDTNCPPLLFPAPRRRRGILPHLLANSHTVQKRLPNLWPTLKRRLGWRFNGGVDGWGDGVLADGRGPGLVCDLAVRVRGFEDAKNGGVGFLLRGFVALGALGCFFRGAECYRGRWGNKGPEVLGKFLNVDVKLILRVGVEVGGFCVGAGCLGDRGAEVKVFLLSLGLVIIGVRGCFEGLDRGGDGVDNVCGVNFLLFCSAENGGEGGFTRHRRVRSGD